jgi:hypothetical protein
MAKAASRPGIPTTSTPPNPRALAVADLNADGRLDVVTANNSTLSVLRGNGNGTLSYNFNSSNFATGGNALGVAIRDCTSDGIPDLITQSGASRLAVLPGRGDATFAAPIQTDGAFFQPAGWVALGQTSMVVAHTWTFDSGSWVTVVSSSGYGTFVYPEIIYVGLIETTGMATGDFNEDGRPDVVVSGYDESDAENYNNGALAVLLSESPAPDNQDLDRPRERRKLVHRQQLEPQRRAGGGRCGDDLRQVGHARRNQHRRQPDIDRRRDAYAHGQRQSRAAHVVALNQFQFEAEPERQQRAPGLHRPHKPARHVERLGIHRRDRPHRAGLQLRRVEWQRPGDHDDRRAQRPDDPRPRRSRWRARHHRKPNLVWHGQVLDATTVIVKYTYAGDVNLDGLVDASDYGTIDNYYQFPGTSGYANGDFNFDGVIDAGDYGLIDNSFQLRGLPL